MKGLKTFAKGGVHPHDRKELASSEAIQSLRLPEKLIIPLQQHIGAPPTLKVEKEAEVAAGDILAEAGGFVSSPIHAPVGGTIGEMRSIYLPNGAKTQAVELLPAAPEGEEAALNPSSTDAKELIDRIAAMGIVGMGGATFPTHVKYSIPKGSKAEFFIANGVECEPYLTADHRLMLEKSSEIVKGIEIAAEILGPDHVYIAIENNKPDAIEAMSAAAAGASIPIEVVPLKLRYPQGDEKMVIQAITGREVPSGGLPIAVGTVVSNVGTLNAIYEAVELSKPLTHRVVTVSGNGIENPGNYLAPIGTPFSHLIEEAGGTSGNTVKIVAGGPMTGFTVFDPETTPVIKGTSGLLALTAKEIRETQTTSCIRCGRCIRVCPVGLSPTLLYKCVDHNDIDAALEEGLNDCRECGSCGFVCPAHIPLVQGMKLGKRLARRRKEAS
ncbi:MAG: electron transport complex subunit RsxC [Spirochaetales bacterium]|nr:electron transport complex subunit RsxC [Spirochaetales bacterium]MCF7937150.1 electron transport complex subunit RsxC [Spirochaetales bacterium]